MRACTHHADGVGVVRVCFATEEEETGINKQSNRVEERTIQDESLFDS
jgi:hypothetical protein